MSGYSGTWIMVLCVSACSSELARHADQQPIMQQQGTELQGIVLQGAQLQGTTLQGFRFAGATLNGAALDNLRLVKGELVAEQNQITLRGAALVDARLLAEAQDDRVRPPQTTLVEYQITDIVAEDPRYDPTQTGATFLYTLAQNVDNTWQPACPVDSDGRRAAIPLASVWDERGNQRPSPSLFTFGCTTGAIAKCYRWGYRPWVTGYGNLAITHWTCTRVARADYCGDGVSHTQNGTLINVWDDLGAPGPIQAQGSTPPGMTFEAAWDQNGATCLSHARWSLGGSVVAAACPNRLTPPVPGTQPGTVCDSVAEALAQGAGDAQMFDESNLSP
ncbi:MAG TPA: ADYC domain-containing protein [Kofleriaceae bacterium]|nr:ADYC domain-containing protein [Kofleriaceae bacterium]